MPNPERLREAFRSLAARPSVSRREGALAADLRQRLAALGAETFIDSAGSRTGSDTGNLIARFSGNCAAAPLLLNAHMDTVDPGEGITVRFTDGVFTSDGTTILGADDKSAIAVLLEVVNVLHERKLPYGPLEMVFTVCEEVGLAGAKNLDFGLLSARYGFTLDGSDTEGIILQTPYADRFEIRITGKDAHAGAHPERGVNAIHLAAKAMAGLSLGRLDSETTCNIGWIQGGHAANIVPAVVALGGEARSHDEAKLQRATAGILEAFTRVVDEHGGLQDEKDLPRLETSVDRSYTRMRIPEDHPLVILAYKAAANLSRRMKPKISGGGSDANIFFEKGIPLGILGTGMREVHSVRESVKLEDMIRSTELLVEIIRLQSENRLGEGAAPLQT